MKNLVTAADVKRLTTVGANADTEKLEKAILDAQTKHLRPLLGGPLLLVLLAFVADGPEAPALGGLPGAQATTAASNFAAALSTWRTTQAASPLLALWDQVQPVLAAWVLYDAWPDLLVHIDNAGIVVKTGNQNGTTSADAATLNQVRDAKRESAVFRGEELVRWLESNKAAYPAYQSTQPLATCAQPIDYFGGISL